MSAESWKQAKKYVDVLGRRISYVEQGHGDPIVLLHGNPTSSYLWRSVVPELAGVGRCIAPDLIGMGDSSKVDRSEEDRYTFQFHREFLDALLQSLGLTRNITFVVHDWGSALGFDWTRRHSDAVRAIAYMEAIVRPFDSWDDWPQTVRTLFQAFRSVEGEDLVLERNVFVERVLPAGVIRALSEEELDEYRRPFREPGESRLPTLRWPRQLPIGGEPENVVQICADYADWFAHADALPKLFVNAAPGSILTGAQREFCRSWPHQEEITVRGRHFVQEDSGQEIGKAIASWLGRLSSGDGDVN